MGTFTKTFGIMSRGRLIAIEDLDGVIAMNIDEEEFELTMTFDEEEFYLQMT